MARRPRYSGKHPQKFHEKYKELAPERYAEDVQRIREAGRTPAGTHIPILVNEILDFLQPRPGAVFLDATLGFGGHAQALLEKLAPNGRLIGLDRDPLQLPKTVKRLRDLGYDESILKTYLTNFSETCNVLSGLLFDGVLADLGLSSMQIDDPSRGFSHKFDGPLDLRMDPSRGLSARELLSKLTPEQLARLFTEHSDEPYAFHFAKGILDVHARTPLASTRALRETIVTLFQSLPRTAIKEDVLASVKRIFQALRIEVNDEFHALDTFLASLPHLLRPGGRAAILSFHSGEDRRVKKAFQAGLKSGVYAEISDAIIRPREHEVHLNLRAKPAKLRWAIRA